MRKREMSVVILRIPYEKKRNVSYDHVCTSRFIKIYKVKLDLKSIS